MRNLIVCDSLAFPKRRRIERVEAATVREAIAPLTDGFVIVAGERWEKPRWDDPLPDDADVAVAPRVADPISILINLVIYAVTTAYNAYEQKRMAAKLARASKLGDDAGSPTYGYAGAQSTTAGPGFAIPTLCGRRRIGGHVISQTVQPTSSPQGEIIKMVIAKSRGPIHAIAGERALPYGERDNMGLIGGQPIPSGIEVNGVELPPSGGAVALRMGHPHQSRLQYFPLQAFVQLVGLNMPGTGSFEVTTQQSEFIDDGYVVIDFPSGLYLFSGGNRVAQFVDFTLQVFDVTGVQAFTTGFRVTALRVQPFAHWEYFNLGTRARMGPYRVRLTRVTQTGDPGQSVDGCVWRSVQQHYFGDFTHPGLALLALSVRANEAVNDAVTSVTSVDDGILVRTWLNDVDGWSELTWGPSPPHWNFDVGRNAAWVIAELLLNKHHGAGHDIRKSLGGTGEEELDLESFRDASFHCDVPDPGDPLKAKYRCDYDIDESKAIEDHVQAMCRTSRIWLAKEGNRIVLRPEYRDEFGPPGYVVPARKELRPLSTSNCASVQLLFINTFTSPNFLVGEFDNVENSYLPDQVSCVDTARMSRGPGNLLPRTVRADVSLRGIVDRRQAVRELFHTLAWFRLSTVEAHIRTSTHAVALQTRDVVWLHHECWFPDPDSPSTGARSRTHSPGAEVSSIVLDRDLRLYGDAQTGTGIFLMDPDGKTLLALTVDAAGPGVIPAGDPVPLWDPVAAAPAAIKITRHTTVIGGKYGVFARRFVVVRMETSQALELEMDLVEWHPDLHDEPDEELQHPWGADEGDIAGVVPPRPPVVPKAPRVADAVQVAATAQPGVVSVTVARESDAAPRGRARVYARPQGTSLGYDLIAEPLGETATAPLEPGVTYEVVATLPGPGGAHPSPDDQVPVLVRVPIEGGPPPAPVRPSATVIAGRRVRLSWPRTQGAVVYEVRRGASWLSARRVVSTRDTITEFEAEEGEHRLMVRARSATGSWSQVGEVLVEVAHPDTTLANLDDTGTAGTHDGTADSADGLVIDGPAITGTYTTPDMDTGEEVELRWSALVDWKAKDLLPVADMNEPVAWWEWPLEGKDVDEMDRGIQLRGDELDLHEEPLEQWSAAVDDRTLPMGYRGCANVEVQFWTAAGGWGDWQIYDGPVVATASKMRARLTLRQEWSRYRVAVDRIELAATPQ